MEYMESGSLEHEIKANKRQNKTFDQNIARIYVRHILAGLEHLHCVKKIIHRDIKPANILISDVGILKLSDFGEAKYLDNISRSVKGTPIYMAPEILDVSLYPYHRQVYTFSHGKEWLSDFL